MNRNNNSNRKNSPNNNSNKNLSLEDMTLGKLILELKKNDEFRRNVKTMFEDTNSPLHQDFDELKNKIADLEKEIAELREEVRRHHQEGGDLGTYTPTSGTADGNLDGSFMPGGLNETTSSLSTTTQDNSMASQLPNLYPSTTPTADGDLEAPFQPDVSNLSQQIEGQSPFTQPTSLNQITPGSANTDLSQETTQLSPYSGTTPLSPIVSANQSNNQVQSQLLNDSQLSPIGSANQSNNQVQSPLLNDSQLSPISSANQSNQVQSPLLNDSQVEPYQPVARQLNFGNETISSPIPTFNAPPSPNSTGGRKKPQQKKKKVVARTVKPKQTAKKINPPKKSKK